jgi:hypothetical protein
MSFCCSKWCLDILPQIADYIQSPGADPGEFAVGLNHEFQPLEGHDIGHFPGLGSEGKMNEAQVYELAK